MADGSVKLFLSCVSDEFGADRDALRRALTLPNVEAKIQEDFKSLGSDTLSKLETYIAGCDFVVHLVGQAAGASPPELAVAGLRERHPDIGTRLPPLAEALARGVAFSYTQWEAWLALAHRKGLLIAIPAHLDPRAGWRGDHLAMLAKFDQHAELIFANRDQLIAQIFAALLARGSSFKRAVDAARQPQNLPFASLGRLFAGRGPDMQLLTDAIANGTPVALTGLGGIGKTRLAIEYALEFKHSFSALLFVRADHAAALAANLAALVAVLDLPEKEAHEDSVRIEAVLNWLAAHPLWLMILDNVDDGPARDAVLDLLPALSGGRILITARLANFPAPVATIELGVIDQDAAAAFLLDRTQARRATAPDDREQARTLAGELGGLALGLEQAGAYIARQRIGIAAYLALWRDKRAHALKWFDARLMGYDHPVGLAAAWQTSVEKLTPASRRLLDRLGFLTPEPIPDSLLDVAVPGEADGYDAGEARAGLYDYSLISPAAGDGFVMHRLVGDFAVSAMTEERRAEALRETLAWINAAFVGDPQDVRNWPVLDPLASHVMCVAWSAAEAGIGQPTSELLNKLGVLLLAKARYGEAELPMRRSLAIEEARLGTNNPHVTTRLNNLAQLLHATYRLGEAEPLMRRALAMDEARLGPNHPNVAVRLNGLARLLHDTSRTAEAEPLMRRALAIDETRFGSNHPNVAKRLGSLGLLLKDTGRMIEGEPLLRRALHICETVHGPEDPETAIAINNVAQMLHAMNRVSEAEPLMRRALAIDKANFGPKHPRVATRLNNLGSLLRIAKRLGEAEPLLRRALAIDEAIFGPEHPHVARDLSNLAQLLKAMDRFAEAEPLMRRALPIDEVSFGPEHPNVVRDLDRLAQLLKATNRLVEAEPLMRRALTILEKSRGPDHSNTITVRRNLAAIEAALVKKA